MTPRLPALPDKSSGERTLVSAPKIAPQTLDSGRIHPGRMGAAPQFLIWQEIIREQNYN